MALFWDTLKPEDVGGITVPANTRKGEFWDTYDNEWNALREGDKAFNQASADTLADSLQAIMDKPLP